MLLTIGCGYFAYRTFGEIRVQDYDWYHNWWDAVTWAVWAVFALLARAAGFWHTPGSVLARLRILTLGFGAIHSRARCPLDLLGALVDCHADGFRRKILQVLMGEFKSDNALD